MIRDGEAGIHCEACGYELRVTTPAEAGALETRLLWREAHPLCPECGEPAVFEDYLGDGGPQQGEEGDDLDRLVAESQRNDPAFGQLMAQERHWADALRESVRPSPLTGEDGDRDDNAG